jgi:YihY family inner membrane protein
MTITERLDRFQRRHPAAGFPLAVVYKFFDDDGYYLAALLTYYSFLALFPLLLLASTVLGFVLAGNPELQQQLLDSALGELPVIGPQLGTPDQLGGGVTGLVVGSLVALYGASNAGQALQYAMNTAWSVPRHRRPDPIRARIRSLALLCTLGLLVLGTTVLATFGSGLARGSGIGIGVQILLTLAAILINAAVFILGFRLSTARPLTVRQVAPGAIAAAVAWQLLQTFGGFYIERVVAQAGSVNAVFALVLGLVAFLYLAAYVLVLCVEIDVVRVDRLYPRSLLTPFTDDVDLTRGDERVYTDAAQAQQAKGFQRVDVRFEDNVAAPDVVAAPDDAAVEKPRATSRSDSGGQPRA